MDSDSAFIDAKAYSDGPLGRWKRMLQKSFAIGEAPARERETENDSSTDWKRFKAILGKLPTLERRTPRRCQMMPS
jgi:hypothetical protein